jgi:hypothetical protein
MRVWITKLPPTDKFHPHSVAHFQMGHVYYVPGALAALLVTACCAVPEIRSQDDLSTLGQRSKIQ